MEALREHDEGAGEISKRVTVAQATLSNTNYQNEYTYTFEQFATRMKTVFTVLEKHGEPYAETAKVCMLCDRIQMEGNQHIQIAKSQAMGV
jgi:ligand-binding sensor protein